MKLEMNSDEVFGLIKTIGDTPGKNDKEAMLKACASSELLKRVLKAACDPTISYGIKKVPPRDAPAVATRNFNEDTWAVLEAMRTRALTGNAMQSAVSNELNSLTAESAELFKRVMLKDLRAGFAENTTNKAFPGLVPDFPYMRCCLPKDTDMSDFDWFKGEISQEKADGMFFNVDHEASGEVFLSSRAGSQFPTDEFGDLIADVKRTLKPGTQSHGEVIVERDGSTLAREIGNGILNSVLKGGVFGLGEKPVFLVWDQIPLTAVVPKGKYVEPYRKRLADILTQVNAVRETSGGHVLSCVRLIPTRIVKSLEAAYAHYGELLAQGKEGTVLKRGKAIWRDGTSKDQIKLKLEFVVDLKVVAIVPGKANGKNAGRPGSLACETSEGLLRVDVTVKNEKLRDEIEANPADWIGKIIKVCANGIMKPSDSNTLYSLFLPRMVEACYRLDKFEPDSLERVFEQEAAAKSGAAIAEAMKKAA